MATPTLNVFFLCLLVYAVFSLPVRHDSKLVHSLDSLPDSKVLKNLNSDTSLNSVAPIFDVNTAKGFRRVKREFISSHQCPKNWVWFGNQCVTYEQYLKFSEEEDE